MKPMREKTKHLLRWLQRVARHNRKRGGTCAISYLRTQKRIRITLYGAQNAGDRDITIIGKRRGWSVKDTGWRHVRHRPTTQGEELL